MKIRGLAALTAVASFFVAVATAQPAHRPPAVPLIANDPYFSVWSMSDHLTDTPTKHWSEAAQPLTGLLRIDGTTYRWMGVRPRQYFAMPVLEAMHQDSVEVKSLHTRYIFSAAGVQLEATFFTPLFPQDLDVMSRPVTYLSWSVSATDGKAHKVDLMLDVDPQIAVNDSAQPVTWGRTRAGALTLLNVGTKDQATLHQAGDRIRIDWGYFHLGVPDGANATTALAWNSMAQFNTDGTLPHADDLAMPKAADWRGHPVHLAVAFPLGEVSAQPVKKHVLLAYTQGYAIEYLGRKMRPYWQRNGMTEAEMLRKAESEYAALDAKGEKFDADLTREMERVGGADYAYLTALAFRQTIAAHKLVADVDGEPMLFSKENASNGCIDTVDVTYPSSPFFLYFNPRLLRAQLEPMMRYTTLPRWRFPFAPHDLGTFPLANGQVYGGGEVTEDNQMPVEESGDLILMIAALGQAEHDWSFARQYMPQLTKWAAYLEDKGMDPENQLSTDDFAGHLAHNTNLSLKAIEALGAFAQIAKHTGNEKLAAHYSALVKTLPAKWEKMARDGDHYRLAFDQPNTWSQEYNLVWDDLLDLHLFPKKLAADLWAFYPKQMRRYGLPLDNRKTITKLDWQIWTGTLTTDPRQFTDLTHRLVQWTDESPSRVPLTDFYDAVSGKQVNFQARSVVGGIFIKALAERGIAPRK
ncbi:MAG: DUF4965 domain-containing protein [Acidobacteria bacterium]|nr:DUF4965 domain-containing protein [Acidobacteriota bacterium]